MFVRVNACATLMFRVLVKFRLSFVFFVSAMPRRFLTVDVLRDTAAIQAAAADIALNGTASGVAQDPELANEWQFFDADTAGGDKLRFPVDLLGTAVRCIEWVRLLRPGTQAPLFGSGAEQRAAAYGPLNPYGLIWEGDTFTLGPGCYNLEQATALAAARARSRSRGRREARRILGIEYALEL